MGGSAPKSPDPNKTASANLNYELGAAGASGIINNPNIYGPTGTVEYTTAGTEEITLPNGQTLKVPRYNQTTTLGQAEQQQKEMRDAQMKALLGQDAIGGLNDYQTDYRTFDPSTKYKMDPRTLAFTSGKGSAEKRRAQFEEDYMARGADLLEENRAAEVARLAAMGLAPGSEKYGRVADQFERSGNDLAIQSRLAGGQEFMNLTGAENARRTGDAAFYNDARDRKNVARGVKTQNKAAEAGFNNQTRQMMINELLGILSGGQISSPAAPGYQGQAVGSPGYANAVNQNYANEVAAYNARMQGLAGLGSAAIGFLPFGG